MHLLDVCQNGTRDYVQGTQMVARAADCLAAETGRAPVLQAATFYRITDKGVGLVPCTADTAHDTTAMPDLLGTLVFGDEDGPRHFQLVEMTDPAPRRALDVAARWSEIDGARSTKLSSRYAITGVARGEDFLNAIVQAVKLLHEDLADDVRDVWLTGFRSANIPMSDDFAVSDGTLVIQARRAMNTDAVWQTLQMVRFLDPNDQPVAQAAVTFTFKSESLDHVD